MVSLDISSFRAGESFRARDIRKSLSQNFSSSKGKEEDTARVVLFKTVSERFNYFAIFVGRVILDSPGQEKLMTH